MREAEAKYRKTGKGRQVHRKTNAKYSTSEKGKAYEARRRIRDREKIRSRKILHNAIRDGKLIRPESCSVSGCDGKDIEGHHEDYSKPLKVTWLCRSCHKLREN